MVVAGEPGVRALTDHRRWLPNQDLRHPRGLHPLPHGRSLGFDHFSGLVAGVQGLQGPACASRLPLELLVDDFVTPRGLSEEETKSNDEGERAARRMSAMDGHKGSAAQARLP